MKILRAEHLGMCFGVRDAIALATQQAGAGPVTILGELVHNETVLASLREKGIRIEAQLSTVNTPTVMITAHGASARTMKGVRKRGLNVIEATCPLVHFAHRTVAKLVRDGYHPFVTAHGYDAYYLNVLAGSRRSMAASDDPAHARLRRQWPPPDPRLPMVSPPADRERSQ